MGLGIRTLWPYDHMTVALTTELNNFLKNNQYLQVVRFLVGLPFPALFQIPFIISERSS